MFGIPMPRQPDEQRLSIIVASKINMAAKMTISAKNTSWVGVESLLNDLYQLVDDRETGDVVFVVGDTETSVYAHRLMLVARCVYFGKKKRDLWSKMYSPGSPFVIRKLGFKPDVFKEVIEFLYTGKIQFKSSTAFESLRIAEDLEISDLQLACEDYFISNLCVENAAEFLTDAMALSGGTGPCVTGEQSKGAKALVDKCLAFMEENAEEVVNSKGFSLLPKPALIKLISSDQFAVSEDEVWRAVLRWAKTNTGIYKPTSQWNEEDRARIMQEMTGVIDYVKLLLIDSTVFAEEVEPTGVVPMELSLERYRFAAVPTRFSASVDPRLVPRESNKLYHNSTILGKTKIKLQKLLNAWYGNESQEWQLLFKASSNNFSAAAFHKNCDGHSPTITIVKGTNGNICGGFSDQPWRNDVPRGKYIPSNSAFLFTLANSSGIPPTKFGVVHSKYATLHHPKFGPMFGAGADLCISDKCNVQRESYSNLPHSYTGAQASSELLMGEYNFLVEEYEVFGLKNEHLYEKPLL